MIDHTHQFEIINRLFTNLEQGLEHAKKFDELNQEVLDEMKFMAESTLETLGNMSTDVKQMIDIEEKDHILKYKHSPALGKRLWLDQYDQIFKPYDKLKQRGWDIIERALREEQRLFNLNNR